jgi:hypothetical protein
VPQKFQIATEGRICKKLRKIEFIMMEMRGCEELKWWGVEGTEEAETTTIASPSH